MAVSNMISSSNHDEEYDSFVLDPGSLAIVHGSATAGGGRGGNGHDGGSRASRSAATTQLATEVGSVVGARKDPFLKSITFFDPKVFYRRDDVKEILARRKSAQSSDGEEEDQDSDPRVNINDGEEEDDQTCEVNDLTHWDIVLKDPLPPGSGPTATYRRKSGIKGKLAKVGDSLNLKKSKGPQLIVEDFEGLVEFSSLEAGDRLVSINKKKIKPAQFSADKAMAFMRECLEKEGVLHVATENPLGKDIVINVTVIKPRPNMTYDDLGLVVWNWPFLCVREVKAGSIFQDTAVKVADQIGAINDIECSKMNEEKFARCVSTLPTEITLTLIRRKHRYTGSYV